MERKEIIVSVVKSNNSDNKVWAVAITGNELPCAHCKTAYKAMRFMFLLKKQTGFNISDNSLARLSHEIASQKAEANKQKVAEVTQQIVETHSVENVLADKPEKKSAKRTRRSKKVVATAAPN